MRALRSAGRGALFVEQLERHVVNLEVLLRGLAGDGIKVDQVEKWPVLSGQLFPRLCVK